MADVPAPVETNRGPRVKTKSGGIGFFIPPELKEGVREKGRQIVNLASALDPVQGLMRGMSASGRAADTELSPEERRAALIEAGIETAAPLAMMGLGALAKQPVKATVLDILTPTGAPQAVVDDVSDPSRRAFMKGAVATGGIAAIAPDVITEALEKVPAAVKRVRGGGHMATVLDSISKNKEKTRELYEKTRDLSKKINPYLESVSERYRTNLPIKTTPEEIQESFEAMGQTRELQKEAGRLESVSDGNLLNLLQSVRNSPKILDEARDEDLEALIGHLDNLPGSGYAERLEDPEFADIVDEIKKRNLHQQKNKDGIDEYPYSRMLVEEYEEGILEINPTTPSGLDISKMKMTDRDTIPVEDLVGRDQEDRAREMIREALVKEFELGQEKGLSSEQIDTNIAIKRRILEKEYGIDFSKADSGLIAAAEGSQELRNILQRKTDSGLIAAAEGSQELRNILQKKADGGEMRKGVGSLSEIARRMNEGGEAKIYIPTQEDLDKMALRVKKTYGFDPVKEALNEGVDPELALRIMMRESSGDHSRGSDKGAIGLMGLMPITAEDVSVDRTDPYENYVGGLRYLKKMQARFGPVEGIAAYNAGPTAVEKYEGIPPFAETQAYVRAVLTPFTGVDYEDQIQEDAETALMQMPVQAAENVMKRPRARPPVTYDGPRPMPRPTLPQDKPQQEEIKQAVQEVVQPQSLREKYSPQGIEQMLTGTIGEPLLPRQFQQGSPYSSMR